MTGGLVWFIGSLTVVLTIAPHARDGDALVSAHAVRHETSKADPCDYQSDFQR
jgi:hypothetical protein